MNESIDISKTIAPKSDQLNADDLIAGPKTITVTGIKLVAEDQPVAIHFEGDDGKPYHTIGDTVEPALISEVKVSIGRNTVPSKHRTGNVDIAWPGRPTRPDVVCGIG